MSTVFTTTSVDATRAFGARIAALAAPGDVYALEGDLGTGKTEFVRGFVGALDPSITVRSPSFAIINIYPAPHYPVYHFDFYRLNDVTELVEIGFDDYLAGNGVCLIEWATMFSDALPAGTRHMRLTDRGVAVREIRFDFAVDRFGSVNCDAGHPVARA